MTISRQGLFVLALAALSALPCSAQNLEDAFKDPPHEYSMVAFWSWNGTMEPAEVQRQVKEMADKGVYGAFMHARAGIDQGETPYFSAGWWKAVDAAVEAGAEDGFRPWIYDEDKWPSGLAGGRTIARNPERNAPKTLRREERPVSGPATVSLDFPGARYLMAARVVSEGILDPDSLVSLDPACSEWACPEGEWLLLAYTFETFPHGVNYLNPETIRDFIDITHEEYFRRYGEQFGSLIPGVFFDEIMNDAGKKAELTVWVEGFEERFRELKGYDLAPLLPALVYDIGPRTPAVRCDYYDVYTDCYERAWFKQIADWCAAHDLMLTGHTVETLNRYTTQGNYMRTMRHLQIPATDNEDFRYTWPRVVGAWKPKQIASIGHLYGHDRIGVEAMGGGSWAFTPDMARYGFNLLAAYGINFFVPHLFHYTIEGPAQAADWPQSWFFQNPYWKYFKTVADHASRISLMLTGGTPVVDVAVLYPDANLWSGYGEGTTQATIEMLTAAQIDADLIDADSLMRAKVENGLLRTGPMTFRALILPGLQCIRRNEADVLEAFIEGGGMVIVHGRWPEDSMEAGRADPHLAAFRSYAEAKGIQPVSIEESVEILLKGLDRDVTVEGQAECRGQSRLASFGRSLGTVPCVACPLRYQHRIREGRDIYWIANGSETSGAWRVRFRAEGVPTYWQPEDGSIRPGTGYVTKAGFTTLDLSLDGFQGCFVVFGGDAPAASIAKASAAQAKMLTLGGEWDFLPAGGQLDDVWRCDLEEAVLELPVMRMRWERAGENIQETWHLPHYEDARWRQVKILDTVHPEAGADRYRSRWNARFITAHAYTPFDLERFFVPLIGGEDFACRKKLELPPQVAGGRLSVVCETPFRVSINGEDRGGGPGGKEPVTLDLAPLREGESVLTIRADGAPSLMAEGVILPGSGDPIPVFTDATWEARNVDTDWIPAWEYLAPPEAPYGEPAYPEAIPSPTLLWYRQTLPAGTRAVFRPDIEGQWQAWADGVPLKFAQDRAEIPACPDGVLLALRVELGEGQHGLLKPIRLELGPTPVTLGSWTGQHLDWYSGRALYSKEFVLEEPSGPVEIDLGKVCYCAEIWINGKLAGTRLWRPYRVDITDYVHAGTNRIDVVAANLLANRMRWDIFDDNKANLIARRWHYSTILRDGWSLESGLVGPVTLKY